MHENRRGEAQGETPQRGLGGVWALGFAAWAPRAGVGSGTGRMGSHPSPATLDCVAWASYVSSLIPVSPPRKQRQDGFEQRNAITCGEPVERGGAQRVLRPGLLNRAALSGEKGTDAHVWGPGAGLTE